MSGVMRNTGFERFASLFGSPLGANLLSLSGLVYPGATAFVKMTAAGTFALDTNTYLTLDQSTPQTLSASPIFDNLTAGRIPFASATKTLTDSANLFWDSANNRLGIGTISPSSLFNAVSGVSDFRFSTGALAVTPTISVINKNIGGKAAALLAGASGSAFVFDNSGFFSIMSEIKSAFTGNSLGTGLTLFRIIANGNVGIGTITPACKLDTTGAIRATTNIHTTGSGYLYLNEASITADTVNDVRIYNTGGTFTVQKCTVASGTKNGGTWATIFSAT